MKNAHPIITATSSGLVSPDSSSSNEPTEPIIRLKLDKPLHWEWELTTSADALPVIQLLDKDGRLLVETTGRTAQRARGSFREGLRSHEEFPVSRSASDKPSTISSFSSTSTLSSTILIPAQGNRNIEGFSTKFGTCQFGYKPRKSRSDASVVKEREKKGRKRYCNESETTTKQQPEETKASSKSYSAGDYLRQQIVEDLRRKHTLGRSPEEIAKERCRKMKAYLRSQSEILPKLVHLEEEESSEGSKPKTDKEKDDVRSRRLIDGLNRLREAIRKEDTLSKKSSSAAEVRHDVSKNDSIRNELSVHPSEDCESTGIESKTKNEELEAVKAFLQRKIQQKMEQERSGSSSRCDSQSQVAIKKRYSDYRQPENLRGYHTRKVRSETNIIRFHPEILQKEKQKSIRQLEKERSSRSNGRPTEDSFDRTVCRRSKSEATLGAAETIRRNHRQRSQTREPTEKRKLYRKTKSDVLIGQMFSSLDSEQENPPRRIKSQDNVDESWREYKERKKHEKLYRESDEMEAKEEDFMGRPRWKDVQARLCSFRNCKICQNLRNCVDPLRQPRVSPENSGISGDAPTNDTSDVISASTSDRPSTSLQENYLVVDGKSDGPMNHVLAKAHLRNRSADLSNVNSPDCGYNTIPKNAFNDYKDLYARSSVKKSDTFKIVDGSEDLEDGAEENDSKTGLDERTVDGYECSGSGGVLTNKSNEDIARDYFKRVYELLKKRQEEAKRMAEMQEVGGCDDSSSSNYVEKVQKKRPRRKKKDRSVQGKR